MASHRLLPSLPRIKVPIGHIPQRLKLTGFKNPRGSLELLRKIVNRVIREERSEFKYNRAMEGRQYVERLIQLGVHRGIDDPYTREMFDWWFIERDVLHKMHDIILPRFAGHPIDEPYTTIHRLPTLRVKSHVNKETIFWNQYSIAVLELKGNPFPSLDKLEDMRQAGLLEFIKKTLVQKPDRRNYW